MTRAAHPQRLVFNVGTQINGAPHLGTNLVQTAAFALGKDKVGELIERYYRAFVDAVSEARDTDVVCWLAIAG